MKNLHVSLLAIIALLSLLCKQSSAQAVLSGSVDSYKGSGYLLCITDTPEGMKYDTVAVQPDGKFHYTTTLEKPTTIGIYLEYLGDDRTVIEAFMTNGTENKVKITSSKNKEGRLISTAEFYGNNKVESDFLKAYYSLMENDDFGLEKAAGFKTFKEYSVFVKEKLDALRTQLNESKDAGFKATNSAKLDTDEKFVPFRFAWAKQNNKERMDADPDFVAYVKSFDLNDTANIENHITDMVLLWYARCEPNPTNESIIIREMKLLKKVISNQEVINTLSTTMMDEVLAMGGSKDMKNIYELYAQINTDTKAKEEMTSLYNQLVKLVKGVPATDFEMQDVNGKTVHFLDVIGKGKTVYIDFWATWCGPCCAEIPYMEKLVEKYKNNPDVEIISISLDSDPKKWHKKLAKDKPQWKQFIIPENFNSTFAKEYNITAIPRFMAFDKEGKIITINAPRPSIDDIEAFLQSCMQ